MTGGVNGRHWLGVQLQHSQGGPRLLASLVDLGLTCILIPSFCLFLGYGLNPEWLPSSTLALLFLLVQALDPGD